MPAIRIDSSINQHHSGDIIVPQCLEKQKGITVFTSIRDTGFLVWSGETIGTCHHRHAVCGKKNREITDSFIECLRIYGG